MKSVLVHVHASNRLCAACVRVYYEGSSAAQFMFIVIGLCLNEEDLDTIPRLRIRI